MASKKNINKINKIKILKVIKVKIILMLILSLMIFQFSAFSQFNKIKNFKSGTRLEILQIDFTTKSTLFFIKYTNNGSSWININDKTKILDKKSGIEYKLINSINMPISDEGEPKFHLLNTSNQIHFFCLEFEKLPDNIDLFDLIEKPNDSNAFNFYNVKYYKEFKSDNININDFIKKSPVKEFGYRITNNKTTYHYKHKGLIISFELLVDNKYGSYYQAWFNIQNFTGSSILFNPNLISASSILGKEKITKDLQVLSYEDYIKKVNRNQNWQNFAVAFSNGLAASSAGYSRSTTTMSTYGVNRTYGSASGYVGDTYGSIYGRSTSYSSAYGQSTTESFNGAAAYAAQQNANAQTEKFINDQFSIKNKISEGYLKVNSLTNQTELIGFINIKYTKTNNIKIQIPLNGENYIFEQNWN